MIPRECRRLVEVDFPVAEVSRHAARERLIRRGHPSTLHRWWARRPLASCRAVLLGLLLPDPCDPLCPEGFRQRARRLLMRVRCVGEDSESLRRALLSFIADFSNWDNSADPVSLGVARGLVRAAYPDSPPLVVDPFAGGGSIPLEALRVGCEAFGSDLNPVACMLLKMMLEDIPRHARDPMRVPTANGGREIVDGLAEAVRRVGALVRARVEKELAEFYPSDPDGARPIACLWARTVRCEAPNCGAEIPLVFSFWLSKRAGRRWALRYQVERPKGRPPEVVFEVFQPKSDAEVPKGTVSRGNATCPACGTVLRMERVQAQLSQQRGGSDVVFDEKGRRIGGARLLAVVVLRPGGEGRQYRLPVERDYEAVWRAQQRLAKIVGQWKRGGERGPCPVPDEPMLPERTLAFRVPRYGMRTWGDLFTARQKLALVTLARAVRELPSSVPDAVRLAMALVVSRCADDLSSLCFWSGAGEKASNTFLRQALSIVWNFSESCDYGEGGVSLVSQIDYVARVVETWPGSHAGRVQLADATRQPLPNGAAAIWFTDPPYYDAVAFADLSDFFFVWLKRTLPGHPLLRDPFDPANTLTPKATEIIHDRAVAVNGQVKDRAFFEDSMTHAFREGRRVLQRDGIGAVLFAHKNPEGWEAFLSSLIRAGWRVTASWPITTEMSSRPRAHGSAALATSVHMIIRPRPKDAPTGDWSRVLRELRRRVGDWMDRFQRDGVRGADLVFACIGSAMEIFSRYSHVEAGEGRRVALAEFLEKVWSTVRRAALQQVLAAADGAGALEDDARLVAMFLWTLQRKAAGGYALAHDVAHRFARPLGIRLPEWEGRVIKTQDGVVRLLTIRERARVLFGRKGADIVDRRIEGTTPGTGELKVARTATTLDRVHTAMILQAAGRTNAMRALIRSEIERGSDFLRLANTLAALYPKNSEERRLVEAMLLAAPR